MDKQRAIIITFTGVATLGVVAQIAMLERSPTLHFVPKARSATAETARGLSRDTVLGGTEVRHLPREKITANPSDGSCDYVASMAAAPCRLTLGHGSKSVHDGLKRQ